MKLSHVRLLTNNFDDTFRFYSGAMGFKATWGAVGETYAHFGVPCGGELALFDRRTMAAAVGAGQLPARGPAQDGFMLIFEVPSVDQAYKDISAKGVKFLTPPTNHKEWGIRTAYLRDPEGNLIELMSELPKTEWDPALQKEAQANEKK